MVAPESRPPFSVGRLLVISVLVSALVGGVTGFGVGLLAHPSPTPQLREFYVFENELPFNASLAGIPHYVFVSDRIVVNKGDTVKIHFFDITDENHTFTMSAPYATDAVLGAATNTSIPSMQITFVASVAGLFPYHCRFHSPTMAGTLVVLG
jgi:plastocyanin